jgi:hypothetical protein
VCRGALPLASIVAVLVEGGGACVNISLNDARPKRAWILCNTAQNAVSHRPHTPPLVPLKEERTTTSDQHSDTVH